MAPWTKTLAFGATWLVCTHAQAACPPGNTLADVSAPTDVSRTFIRKGNGEFGSRNPPHQGTDITVRASYADANAYSVRAMADGIIVYARFNGAKDDPFALDGGFGNTVIIDHRRDCYSMYAHLASDPFTPIDPAGALIVKVGQEVTRGSVIGYFVDQTKGVYSTGNAMRTVAGARWQTHVVFIDAPSGWKGTGGIGQNPLGGKYTDASPVLRSLGYKVEAIAPGQ